jgi:hypothetical protein
MFAASAVIGRQAAKTLGQRAFRATPRAFGGADEPVRRRDARAIERDILGLIFLRWSFPRVRAFAMAH